MPLLTSSDNAQNQTNIAAFAALLIALLKEHPHRDTVLTRWREYLPHALALLGPSGYPVDATSQQAMNIVAFVETALQAPPSMLR